MITLYGASMMVDAAQRAGQNQDRPSLVAEKSVQIGGVAGAIANSSRLSGMMPL